MHIFKIGSIFLEAYKFYKTYIPRAIESYVFWKRSPPFWNLTKTFSFRMCKIPNISIRQNPYFICCIFGNSYSLFVRSLCQALRVPKDVLPSAFKGKPLKKSNAIKTEDARGVTSVFQRKRWKSTRFFFPLQKYNYISFIFISFLRKSLSISTRLSFPAPYSPILQLVIALRLMNP